MSPYDYGKWTIVTHDYGHASVKAEYIGWVRLIDVERKDEYSVLTVYYREHGQLYMLADEWNGGGWMFENKSNDTVRYINSKEEMSKGIAHDT